MKTAHAQPPRAGGRSPARVIALVAIGLALAWRAAAGAASEGPPAPMGVAPSAPAGAGGAAPATSARWARMRSTTFQTWNADSGLPHPIVTALAQDGDGFVWVGTQDGLARWDGYRFKVYRADHSPRSLPSSYVDTLHADRAGQLWIGTDDGKLARYDARTDRFDTIDNGAASKGGAEFSAIVDDGRGGLWIGSSRGLQHVEPSPSGAPAAQARLQAFAPLRAGDGVHALLRDSQGALWIGTQHGLMRCARPGDAPQCETVPFAGPAAAAPAVGALAQSADGRIWIGTLGAGVFVDDPATGKTQPVPESDPGPSSLATADVATIAQTPDGDIWVATNGVGIVVIDPTTLATRRIRQNPMMPAGLPSDALFAVLVDRSGLLWYGGRRGLSRTDPRQSAISTIFGQIGRPDGITDTDAPTLMAADDGKLWVGLADNGIDILDPLAARVAHLDIARVAGPSSAAPGLAARAPVAALVQTARGDVYIGTRDGLFHSDSHGGQLRQIPWSTKRRPAVHSLLISGHRLWIGARTEGLWSLDLEAGADAAPERPPGYEALTDERIVTLHEGVSGEIWIGTPTGLDVYDPASHRVEHTAASAADPQSLSSDFVSCILIDRAHRIWIGTLGGGLNLVTGRDAHGRLRFRRFGPQDGLPTPNIGQLLQATDGAIWASTDGGFAVIDPATLAIRPVLRADGAAITSYWINSGVATTPDELVFGGGGGITVIHPAEYRSWNFRPPVVITETRIQGRVNDARAPDGLTLAPGENSFSIEFAALDYSAPERNRYAYRLVGADSGWNDTDATKRLASYTNLAPGNYELQLRGSNRNGAWSDTDLKLAVHVHPLWYQSWWAHLAEAVALLLAVMLIVRLRTRSLVLRKRQLQEEVAARTRELEEKQQELLRANETLAQLANFDPLTRLLNRRAFMEQGEQHLRDLDPVVGTAYCLMLDIDHFKFFNDNFGHPTGDAVIRGVAAVLQRALRSGDLICRYGGEEFCVLLVGIDDAIARMLAERIRARVQKEAGPGVRELPGVCVTVSVGIAAWSAEAAALDKLIGLADQALYAAKHGGRNCVAAGPQGPIVSSAPLPPQWIEPT